MCPIAEVLIIISSTVGGRRETARCFASLNNSQVTQGHSRLFDMTPLSKA